MRKTKQLPASTKRGVTSMNYLEYIEQILELSEKMEFSNELLDKCAPYAQPLAKALDITEIQVILLSIFVKEFDNPNVDNRDFTTHFACSNISILKFKEEFEELRTKGYLKKNIRRGRYEGQSFYLVNPKALEAIQANKPYHFQPVVIANEESFFDFLSSVFEDDEGDFDMATMYEELADAVNNNLNLHFCKEIKQLDIMEKDEEYHTFTLLLFFCHKLYNDNDHGIVRSDFDWLGRIEKKRLLSRFRSKSDPLLTMGLIEPKKVDSLFDREVYSLTKKALQQLLPNLPVEEETLPKEKALLSHKELEKKMLYYNECEGAEVAQLTSLLMEKNFKKAQKNLEKKGMRKGFASLLYGAPGTGKTETVYQIAKQTGRDIYQVNISQIKSMWVGESEKNIQQIFDTYQRLVNSQKRIPILLFNEADAVLGVRMNGAERAVDKMENAIQNIILQEMEKLEGIMIATTNITGNLDTAFERRFLYKVAFQKPCQEAKAAIWQTMLPSLSEATASTLAAQYHFSGGQIENIARKHTIETVLTGKEPTTEMLHQYCQAEHITENDHGTKVVGFVQ